MAWTPTHRTAVSLFVLLAIGTGCYYDDTGALSVRQTMARPASTGAPTSPPEAAVPHGAAERGHNSAALASSTAGADSARPIASVNGVAIDRRDFTRLLVQAHGLPMLHRIILRDLARQEAAKTGIQISRADVDAEYDQTIRESIGGEAAGAWTPSQREKFIDELVRLRGWSREELDIVMERQALLRRLVDARVKVTPDLIEKEYARQNGEKVEVRHIQLSSPRLWPELKSRLDRGEDFAQLAAAYSENRGSRANGGLLPAFTRDDPGIPPIFAKVAFSLQPGEVSVPVAYEGSQHVFKMERRIPASGRSLEQSRPEIEATLRKALVGVEMEKVATELMRKCELRIDDPGLRDQYRAQQGSGQMDGPALAGS